MRAIRWAALVRLGLQKLRLLPREFWDLTPVELMLMLGSSESPPLTRARLNELALAFPDQKGNRDDGI